ncbi:MAG: threonine/serine dehydratase [Paracoccaceae bacterium]
MNIEMIMAAATRLAPVVRRTPLLSSPFLDEIAGRRVFVKAECLQHTGSFKFRGGWAAVSALEEAQRAGGVIAFSSGNHAQGVALAAQRHGIEAVIIMPHDAPELKISNTRAFGADVVLYDRLTEDRDKIGDEMAAARGLTLIKPFNEPQAIAGQGTVGLEIAEQAAFEGITNAEVIVCCGGGGLTSGIALALADKAPSMRVRPCEPMESDDVARSLRSGMIEVNATVANSICDAILTPSAGDITFEIMKNLCGSGLAVSDHDAMRAMAHAFRRLKIVLEPGGAVALAAALFQPEEISGDAVIVVATGGNVDPNVFARSLETLND